METKITLIIPESAHGQRLDKALNCLDEGLSRTRVQDLIKMGKVTLNGNCVLKGNTKVHEGDEIALDIPDAEEAEPKPQNIPLDIVYEDDDLIVINKPAGLVVHPAPGHSDKTLVNALLFHCQSSLSGIGGVKRPGILHRLDQHTSGLMVVAKNDLTHRALSSQFKEDSKTLKRKYLAWVWNRPPNTEDTITSYLGRSQRDRKKMSVVSEERGKRAVSHYKILKTWSSSTAVNFITQLEFVLSTGRTHQIRVHCEQANIPILADEAYGLKREAVRVNAYWPQLKSIMNRQALHAFELSFWHPTLQKEMVFNAPLPADLARLSELLG